MREGRGVSTPSEAAPTVTVFRYETPVLKRSKAVKVLCRSDRLFGAVQVLKEGGENNLHAHDDLDGFWFVLSGRVRFLTVEDRVDAELGPYEGILVPRNYPYWFESIGNEVAELLQVECSASAEPLGTDEDIMRGRIDYEPRRGLLAENDTDATTLAGAGDDDRG